MTMADDVRTYCADNYIEPARRRGDTEVVIRAGDIHQELGYRNRMPLVCAALGTELFERMCRVERIGIEGPTNGANARFRFRLLA